MGTYDTRGGSPLSDPAFDSDRAPSELEDRVLESLEASQSLRQQYQDAHETARLAVQEALRALIRPGDILQKRGDKNGPAWLLRIDTVTGNDRGAQQFEIAGEVVVELHHHHSASTWRTKAFALNKDGKRLSGRTHHGAADGSITIYAPICLDLAGSVERHIGPHDELMEMVEAAAWKLGEAGDEARASEPNAGGQPSRGAGNHMAPD